VLSISANEKSVEDVVADWYSFQNIESISQAFNGSASTFGSYFDNGAKSKNASIG
jgi:hypothetical protein